MAKMIIMKLKNIETRSGWHHFRMNVPKDLQERMDKKVIKQSLETQDDLTAQRLAERLTEEYKDEFKAMRADNPEKNLSIDERIEAMRQTMCPTLDDYIADIVKYDDSEIALVLERLEEEHDSLVRREWKYVTVRGLYDDLRTATREEKDPRMVRRVVRLYREMLNHCYVGLKEELGLAIDIPFRAPSWKASREAEGASSGGHRKKVNKLTPLDCLKEILNDGTNRRGTTDDEMQARVALFEKFIGVKPIHEYTREDIVSFRDDCLRKLPKHGQKRFPELTLKELLAMPEEDAERPSATTVNNKFDTVKQVFKHALARGIITVNPCATVKNIKKQKKAGGSRADDKAFTAAEVQEIMAASRTQDGKERPSRRWATQLLVHYGMRANECCQLKASQIDVDAGTVDIEVIDPKTQHIKTEESSERFLPLPSVMLKDEEFKAYVRKRQSMQGDVQLWSDLTMSSRGKWYRNWSYWFNRLPCVDTKRSAHGLRHAAITRGRIKDIPLDKIQRVVGHSDGSGMTDNYTNKRDMLEGLRTTVEAMAFTED